MTNTGAFTLTGDLDGPITAFTNAGAGTVNIGDHQLTGVTTFTNNSTSSSAVRIAIGGQIGTSEDRTIVNNTAGGFVSNGTIYANTLSNSGTGIFENTGTVDATTVNVSGGTFTSSGTVIASIEIINSATMHLSGVMTTPEVTNTGVLDLLGNLVAQDATFYNDPNGTLDVGVYSLTGMAALINNSQSASAVNISYGGSIGSTSQRVAVTNKAGTFRNAGSLYATTLDQNGGTYTSTSTGLTDVATSITNTSGTMNLGGTIKTPRIENSGTINFTGSNAMATTLVNNGTFDISGTSSGASFATMSGNGGMALGARTLTLTAAEGETYSGAISGVGGALVVDGGAKRTSLTLTGTNTFTGGLTIRNVLLSANGDAALGGSSGPLNIDGSTLKALGNIISTRPVSLTHAAIIDTNGYLVQFTSVVSGDGSLQASGGGKVALLGVNTYKGGTIVDYGTTLIVNSDSSLGDKNGKVVVQGTVIADKGFVSAREFELGVNGKIDSNNNAVDLRQSVIKTTGANGLQSVFGGTAAASGLWTLSSANGLVVTGLMDGSGKVNAKTVIEGTLKPGNSPGTLEWTQPLAITSTAETILAIDGLGTGAGAGNFSRVLATGAGNTITVDGVLKPILRGITGSATNTFDPKVGQSFLIFDTEAGVLGSFKSLEQPSSDLIFGSRFDTVYTKNAITLYVTPASYKNLQPFGVSLNANQTAVGGGLDALRPAPGVRNSEAAAPILGTLFTKTPQVMPALFDQMSPSIYGATLASGLHNMALGSDTVGDWNALRRGFSALDRRATFTTRSGITAWISGLHDIGRASDVAGSRSSATSTGFVSGFEWEGDKGVFGVAASYMHASVSSKVNQATGNMDLGQIGPYGSLTFGNLFVDARLLGAFGTLNASRSLPTFGLTAKGSNANTGVSGAVVVGQRMTVGSLQVEPSVGLKLDSLRMSDSTENGASILSLTTKGTTATNVASTVGVRMQSNIPLSFGIFAPTLNLQWVHGFNGATLANHASFVGAPGAQIETINARIGGDGLLAKVGGELQLKNSITGFGFYRAELYRNLSSHTFNVGLASSW